jgi:hypothetical protein
MPLLLEPATLLKNDFTRHCPNINVDGHKIQLSHIKPKLKVFLEQSALTIKCIYGGGYFIYEGGQIVYIIELIFKDRPFKRSASGHGGLC